MESLQHFLLSFLLLLLRNRQSIALRHILPRAAFDNSMGWLSYDPAAKKASVGSGETVPATYDFDWMASSVPCASPKKLQ